MHRSQLARLARNLAPVLLLLGGPVPGAADVVPYFEPSPYLSYTGLGLAAALGDLDGDGWEDFGFGFSGTLLVPGHAEIRSGFDGSVLHRFDGTAPQGVFGWAVTEVEDVDGDGRPDLAVAAPGWSPLVHQPYVVVYSSATGAELSRATGSSSERFGVVLTSLGDVDGDGRGDLAATLRLWDGSGSAVRVLSGATGATLRTFTPPQGVVATGFGEALASLPDRDGDGVRELLIGHDEADRASIHSPATGQLLHAFVGPAGSGLGWSVAELGDVDLDGVSDVGLGAPWIAHASQYQTGTVYVHSGATDAVLMSFDAVGQQAALGEVSGIGDFDGDGHADVAVSWLATHVILNAFTQGDAQIRSGADGSVLADIIGRDVQMGPAGDLDGDGVPDLMTYGFGYTEVWLLGRENPELAVCGTGGTSEGCYPTLGVLGSPSPSFGPELELLATGFPVGRPGFAFYGFGTQSKPFGPATLCVRGPFVRLPQASLSSGTLDCFADFAPLAVPKTDFASHGWTPGTTVYLQWYGHGAPGTRDFGLSDAVELTIWP